MANTSITSPEGRPLQVFRHPSFRTIAARLDLVRGINASIPLHPQYRDDAAMPPSQETLKNCEVNLFTVHAAVEAGNRTLVPQRAAAVLNLDEALYHFVHYAEKKGRRDPNALYNIGLDSLLIVPQKKLAKVSAPGSAPSRLQVVNGGHPNQMQASVGTMAGVRSWELWMKDGDPNDDSRWQFYKTFFKCNGMLIAGVESGKVYHFRIRGVNSGGMSPWSAVVSMRAL